ncbi:MAG: hypothetical protein ACFCU1_14130 [Sumerlaeia bacterium]
MPTIGEYSPDSGSSATSSPLHAPDNRLAFAVLAGILLLTLWLYWPVLSMPLFSESYTSQELSARINPLEFFFTSAFLQYGEGVYYRPVTRALDGVLIRLTGGAPNGPIGHGFSLALHLMASALLFAFLWQRTHHRLLASALATLWFALHPAHTAAVVFISVRWNLYSLVLFLLCVNLYQFLVLKNSRVPSWKLGCLLAVCVLPIPFVAEVGVVLSGILGLWILWECTLRKCNSTTRHLVIPLLVVPVIYLAFRFNALGGFGEEYHEAATAEISLFRRALMGSLYDLQILILPLRLELLTSGQHVYRVWLASFAVLGSLLLWGPFRRSVSSVALVPVGLAAFALLQSVAVWKTVRGQVSIEGIERAYVMYFPICLIAILIGLMIIESSKSLGQKGRVSLITILSALLLFAVMQTRASVALWAEGGRTLNKHRQQLEPWLRDKEDELPIYARGFPEVLKAPYQPIALVYFFDIDSAFEVWSQRLHTVLWRERHGALGADFDGWLVEAQGDDVRIIRLNKTTMLQYYTQSNPNPSAPPFDLLARLKEESQEGVAYPSGLTLDWDAEPLKIMTTSGENSLLVRQELQPKQYGYVELEYRLPKSAADSTASPPTPYFQLYWRNDVIPLSEENSASIPLTANGQWHTVRHALYPLNSWLEFGPTKLFRLDPLTVRGEIEIRRLQFVTGLDEEILK